MWPFKSKSTSEYTVTVFRKKIAYTKEKYSFKASSPLEARVMFMLWWTKRRPLEVEQTAFEDTHTTTTCEASFLKDSDKPIVANHRRNASEYEKLSNEIAELAKKININ